MTTPIRVLPGATSEVTIGGTAVVAIFANAAGGLIVNPASSIDQNTILPEILFVDITNSAGLAESATTIAVQPGYSVIIPANSTSAVSVNAATSGHLFTSIVYQPATQYPPTPIPSNFPPSGPTGILKTIPSYLYQQYTDDDNLWAFVNSYNALAQEYVDWFNQIQLPVYTSPTISGTLLDWVAEGLYGIIRPSLSSGLSVNYGPLNTYEFNTLPLNVFENLAPTDVVATSDDIFKRIITWNFFKGDGRTFNIRYLKRRVMRFLDGIDGTNPNIDSTYQVSVSFGVGNQVNITLLAGERIVTGGAIFGTFELNSMPFNELDSYYIPYTPLNNGAILEEAIATGALQLPFQYTYVVTVQ